MNMKKLLLILGILMLNSNLALAANNFLDANWWKTATLDSVKTEIAKGTDVNASGNDTASNGDLRTNVTPLMFALKYANPSVDIIEALIKAGADVNAKEKTVGLTPLIYAIQFKNLETINALIKAGADVNVKNKDGYTALASAAMNNKDPEVVKALIDAGADTIVYIKNMTTHVINLASIKSNQPVVDLFLQEYKNADSADKAEFEATFEGCLATEEYHQDVKSSMSQRQQLNMMADNIFSFGMTSRQLTQECKCIFTAIGFYLEKEKGEKAFKDFENGRRGSAKKAFRTAIPAAFLSCY